jgi:hypothetical protein
MHIDGWMDSVAFRNEGQKSCSLGRFAQDLMYSFDQKNNDMFHPTVLIKLILKSRPSNEKLDRCYSHDTPFPGTSFFTLHKYTTHIKL